MFLILLGSEGIGCFADAAKGSSKNSSPLAYNWLSSVVIPFMEVQLIQSNHSVFLWNCCLSHYFYIHWFPVKLIHCSFCQLTPPMITDTKMKNWVRKTWFYSSMWAPRPDTYTEVWISHLKRLSRISITLKSTNIAICSTIDGLLCCARCTSSGVRTMEFPGYPFCFVILNLWIMFCNSGLFVVYLLSDLCMPVFTRPLVWGVIFSDNGIQCSTVRPESKKMFGSGHHLY